MKCPDAPLRALVTGGHKGIGLAISTALVQAGYDVTIVGRDQVALEAVSDQLGTRHRVCDVTDEASVKREIGGLDPLNILVNCAGQAESAPFLRYTSDMWNRMLAVNLTSAFLCTQAVLPPMREAGWGRIVNIASTGGLSAYPYVAGYIAAKHGVIGLTRALAQEFATSGVTCNAVCPGFTRTEMYESAVVNVMSKTGRTREEAERDLVAKNPQRKVVEPEEIAATVLWVLSPLASSINGQSLAVAGGEIM